MTDTERFALRMLLRWAALVERDVASAAAGGAPYAARTADIFLALAARIESEALGGGPPPLLDAPPQGNA